MWILVAILRQKFKKEAAALLPSPFGYLLGTERRHRHRRRERKI
jgi:hypothetical protein